MYSGSRKRRNPDSPTHGNKKQKRHNRISEGDEGNQAGIQDASMGKELPSQQAVAFSNNNIKNSKVYQAYCEIWEDFAGYTDNGDLTAQYRGDRMSAFRFCTRIYNYLTTFKIAYMPHCDDEHFTCDLHFTEIATQLNNLGSDFGQREWNRITDDEVEEFYGQENCLQLLRDLWSKVQAHPLCKGFRQ